MLTAYHTYNVKQLVLKRKVLGLRRRKILSLVNVKLYVKSVVSLIHQISQRYIAKTWFSSLSP